MRELDDHQLLAEFVSRSSEDAFTELVGRYAGLVYSTALRFCSNPHHAEEVAQAVFAILARKAGTLSPRVVVSGWLYQTTRFTAANFMKREIRRRRLEQDAVLQSRMREPDSAHWDQIAPLLDVAMGALGDVDRNAVLLRHFEHRTSAQIGAALRMNEETARKRVNRALEKLRCFFLKHGVTLSNAALSEAISANSIQPVTAALVKGISAVAVAKGAAGSIYTSAFLKATSLAMKTKAIVFGSTAAVVIVGAGIYLAAKSSGAGPRTPTPPVTFPILLANATFKRDVDDPLFEVGFDPAMRRGSNSPPAIYIKGPVNSATNFDDSEQQKKGISAMTGYKVSKGSPLLGKRIRITAWLKSRDLQSWAALWFCIWSKPYGFCRMDQMDDLDRRPVLRGTMDWKQFEIVTDVPNEPCTIVVGPNIHCLGELWGDDFQIDLAPDAPITDDSQWRYTSQTPNTYSKTDDTRVVHDGQPTVCLAYVSKGPPGDQWMWWGRKIRAADLDKYRGHSVRMTAWVKLENAGRLEPSVRVWDNNGHWAPDSMSRDYTLRGTLNWTKVSVVGAVAKDSAHLDTQFILWGSGKAWIDMDELKLEAVQ